MAWVVLIVSGLFEAVWAHALAASDGLRRLGPSLVFVASLALSMSGLGWALKSIPVGVGYAAWVGVGAIATVAYSFASGAETLSLPKVVCLAAIVGGIVGLKLLTD